MVYDLVQEISFEEKKVENTSFTTGSKKLTIVGAIIC